MSRVTNSEVVKRSEITAPRRQKDSVYIVFDWCPLRLVDEIDVGIGPTT